MNKLLLSLLIAILMIGSLMANPFQSMGFLRVPDAYLLPHKAADIQFGNYIRRKESRVNAPFEYVPVGSINAGLFDRVELGFVGGDQVYFMNAKIRVVKETEAVPQVALGMENIFSKIPEDFTEMHNSADRRIPDRAFYEKNSPYVAISKETMLPLMKLVGLPNLRAFGTFGWGQNRFLGQDKTIKKIGGVFASLEVRPVSFMSFIGEMDGQNFNVGARYTWRNFSTKLAYIGLEEKENMRLGLGISCLFNKYSPKPEPISEQAKNKPMTREDAEKYVQELLAQEIKKAQTDTTGTIPQIYTKADVDRIVQQQVEKILSPASPSDTTATDQKPYTYKRLYTEEEVNRLAEEKAKQLAQQKTAQQPIPSDTTMVQKTKQPTSQPENELVSLLFKEIQDMRKQQDEFFRQQKEEMLTEKAKRDSALLEAKKAEALAAQTKQPEQIAPQMSSGKTPIENLLEELTKLREERKKMQNDFQDLIKTLDKLEKTN